MQLWTHHHSSFAVDAPDIHIDPRQGDFWRQEQRPDFRYREILPLLWERLATDQFLWCCTKRGTYPRVTDDIDLAEWELNVPTKQIIKLYSGSVWLRLLAAPNDDDWAKLMITLEGANLEEDKIGALVSVPLPAGCAKCHGLLPAWHKAHRVQ